MVHSSKSLERLYDSDLQLFAIALDHEFVAGAFYRNQFVWSWNEFQRVGHFLDRGEAVSGSENEESGGLESWEVCGS